jgi:hypothetical protein
LATGQQLCPRVVQDSASLHARIAAEHLQRNVAWSASPSAVAQTAEQGTQNW